MHFPLVESLDVTNLAKEAASYVMILDLSGVEGARVDVSGK